MSTRRIVTFTTDFGTRDTFAGQLKGPLLSICPDAIPVDLTHDVPPHDVAAGAYLLATGVRAFPGGTIHVAVVDPGVGTARRGVVVRTERSYFVAPDNGILSRVLDEERLESAHVLEAAHYRRESVSATFEGRDVFAPAAGWLARGVDIATFGPRAGELARIPYGPGRVEIEQPFLLRVLTVDRFGNVTLDLPRSAVDLAARGPGPACIRVETSEGAVVCELRRAYADGDGDEPFLIFNSADHLEIAVREGRAADRLALTPGARVTAFLSAGD